MTPFYGYAIGKLFDGLALVYALTIANDTSSVSLTSNNITAK
jgi:hypothetical protein